jgi:hypothetical protein
VLRTKAAKVNSPQEKHRRQDRSHERVEAGDDLGQEPEGDQALDTARM